MKLCVKGSNIFKMSLSAVVTTISDVVINDNDAVYTDDDNVYMNDFVDNECFFTLQQEFFQGESLSHFLFSMLLNDLNDNLKNLDDVGVKLDEWLFTVLIFADDTVIFSETRSGLQNGLNLLEKYCSILGLTVNINKTKCVAFRNGRRIGELDKWTYSGEELETINQFKYLGFCL